MLKDGQKLKVIFWPDNPDIMVGRDECESITVYHETGQMAMVPWVRVKYTDGLSDACYNVAMLQGFALLKEQG